MKEVAAWLSISSSMIVYLIILTQITLCSTVAKATSSLMQGQEYRPTKTHITEQNKNENILQNSRKIGTDKGD